MSETIDEDLYRRVEALLDPGEIELDGLVIHTDLTSDEEPTLHRTTVEAGDCIAGHVTDEDTYVYSGNDDPDFGLNQHQGLTLSGDEFVWECQQLIRDGTYDVVFYYEKPGDNDTLCAAVEELTGFPTVGVEG